MEVETSIPLFYWVLCRLGVRPKLDGGIRWWGSVPGGGFGHGEVGVSLAPAQVHLWLEHPGVGTPRCGAAPVCGCFAVDPNDQGGEVWTQGGSCCKFWGYKSLTGMLRGSGVVSRCLETKSQLGHLRVASWWEHPRRLGGVLEMKAVPWGLPFLGSRGPSHSSLTTA